MSIYIFSKPAHAGKTTALQNFCTGKENIAGILMPDIDGQRKMKNIETGGIFDAEVLSIKPAAERIVSIGRYSFYKTAFEKANGIIKQAVQKGAAVIIVDEVGKLEMRKEGFYDSLQYILAHALPQTKIILVVRDSFVEDVVSFFAIKNFKVIKNLSGLL